MVHARRLAPPRVEVRPTQIPPPEGLHPLRNLCMGLPTVCASDRGSYQEGFARPGLSQAVTGFAYTTVWPQGLCIYPLK